MPKYVVTRRSTFEDIVEFDYDGDTMTWDFEDLAMSKFRTGEYRETRLIDINYDIKQKEK